MSDAMDHSSSSVSSSHHTSTYSEHSHHNHPHSHASHDSSTHHHEPGTTLSSSSSTFQVPTGTHNSSSSSSSSTDDLPFDLPEGLDAGFPGSSTDTHHHSSSSSTHPTTTLSSDSASSSSSSSSTPSAPPVMVTPPILMVGTIKPGDVADPSKRRMIWAGEWAGSVNDFDPANPAAIRSAFKYEFNVPIGGHFTLPLHTNAAAVANPVLPSLREHSPIAFPYAGYYMYKTSYDAARSEWNEVSTKEGASAKGAQICKIRFGGEPTTDAYRPNDVPLKDVIGVSGEGQNPILGRFTINGCYHAGTGRIWVWKVYPPRSVNRSVSAQRVRTVTATTPGGTVEPPKTRMRSEINDLTSTAVAVISGTPKEDDAPKVNPRFSYEPVPRDLQLMMNVYLAIRNHKFRPSVFIRPVDATSYPDYYEKITSPMWLDEVEQRLTSGAYKNADEFRADMRLIWDNARRYSPKETSVHQDAIYFEKVMNVELEKAERILTREIKIEREKREKEEEERRRQEEEAEKELQRREERKRKEEEIRRKKEEEAARKAAAAAAATAAANAAAQNSHSSSSHTSSSSSSNTHHHAEHTHSAHPETPGTRHAEESTGTTGGKKSKGGSGGAKSSEANTVKTKPKTGEITMDITQWERIQNVLNTVMQFQASQVASNLSMISMVPMMPVTPQVPVIAPATTSKASTTTSSTAKKTGKTAAKRAYDEDDGASDNYDDDDDYKRTKSGTGKRASTGGTAGKKARKNEPSSSSSSASSTDWFHTPLTFDEKQKLIDDAGNLNEKDLERLSQMMREEQVNMDSSSGEVELNVDDLPVPTLRRMQRFVAEQLGKPLPGPSANTSSSSSSSNTGGGGKSKHPGRQPSLPENEQRELISRASTVAQERLHGTSSSSGPSRTIFDDDDDVAPPPPF